MELTALHKRVIGRDVHQAQITACARIEEADGATRIEQRQFGAFKRDRRALAEWAAALRPDEVVMESSGIYWKSPYAALEAAGMRAQVVHARHVKNVPGRKPMSAMRNGWPRWRVPACCAGRSSRRPNCGNCG
jgi:transposase